MRSSTRGEFNLSSEDDADDCSLMLLSCLSGTGFESGEACP